MAAPVLVGTAGRAILMLAQSKVRLPLPGLRDHVESADRPDHPVASVGDLSAHGMPDCGVPCDQRGLRYPPRLPVSTVNMSTVKREPERVPINVGTQAKRIKQQVKIDGAIRGVKVHRSHSAGPVALVQGPELDVILGVQPCNFADAVIHGRLDIVVWPYADAEGVEGFGGEIDRNFNRRAAVAE